MLPSDMASSSGFISESRKRGMFIQRRLLKNSEEEVYIEIDRKAGIILRKSTVEAIKKMAILIYCKNTKKANCKTNKSREAPRA